MENVKVSVAGRSSRWISKLSYNVKIKKKADNDLFGYKKFKLRAMGYDASYIRERVAFATLKSVGVPCTEYSYIRYVLLNRSAMHVYSYLYATIVSFSTTNLLVSTVSLRLSKILGSLTNLLMAIKSTSLAICIKDRLCL